MKSVSFKKIKSVVGFTLIELLLVLGIGAIATTIAVQVARRDGDNARASAAADQMKEVSIALSSYITRNYSAGANLTGAAVSTVTILQLQAANLLPAVFKANNVFGSPYSIRVVRSGVAPAWILTGLVASTNPWLDEAGRPRYDLLGTAVRKMGAQGGMTFFSAANMSGLDGGWALSSVQYPNINIAGQLGIRTFFGQQYDDIYLRRDGTLPMLGDLDMGGRTVNNSLDGNFSGNINLGQWLYGNHIMANDGQINNVFATYVRTTNMDANKVSGTGVNSLADFDFIRARANLTSANINTQATDPVTTNFGSTATSGITGKGYLNVEDISLRDVRGRTVWLSNILPRFSSRGVYAVGHGSILTKPNCNYRTGGTVAVPKIELIPQLIWTNSAIGGTTAIDFSAQQFSQAIYGTGNSIHFATDLGSTWQVTMYTPAVGNGSVDQYNTGLAHIYCDFGV